MLGRMALLAAAGAGRLWTPAEIATGLWLDASDATTITTVGSAVSEWRDKKGNGVNATQATSNDRPTLTAQGLNNFSVISFSGQKFLNISFFPFQSTFIVYQDSSTNQYATPLGAGDTAITNEAAYHGNVNNTAIFGQYTSLRTTNGQNFRNGSSIGNGLTTPRPSTYQMFSFIASSAFDTASLRLLNVGADRAGPASRAITGGIAEIVMLSTAASTQVRQQMEGYLAWKWGLQGSLPAGHPYKNNAPTT